MLSLTNSWLLVILQVLESQHLHFYLLCYVHRHYYLCTEHIHLFIGLFLYQRDSYWHNESSINHNILIWSVWWVQCTSLDKRDNLSVLFACRFSLVLIFPPHFYLFPLRFCETDMFLSCSHSFALKSAVRSLCLCEELQRGSPLSWPFGVCPLSGWACFTVSTSAFSSEAQPVRRVGDLLCGWEAVACKAHSGPRVAAPPLPS